MPMEPAQACQEIANSIREGKCTPIISNRLMMDHLLGSNKLVREYAKFVGYPVNETCLSMAQIAQYAVVHSRYKTPRQRAEEVKKSYQRFLVDQVMEQAVREQKTTTNRAQQIRNQWPQIFTKVVAEDLQYQPGTPPAPASPCPTAPQDLLAQLDVPIYVTTSYHTFLERSLERWRGGCLQGAYVWKTDTLGAALTRFTVKPDFDAIKDPPLVYHLFGIDEVPESMLMSVDDHLDFVIGMYRDYVFSDPRSQMPAIPHAVQSALRDKYLLFLGYRMDDWELRVLLKAFFGERAGFGGAAIQIDPGEDNTGGLYTDVASYRTYLEEALDHVSLTTVIGEPVPFLTGLWRQIHPEAGGA